MNDLTIKTDVTMNSREIAELTNKRHDHVLRDIELILSKICGVSPDLGKPEEEYHRSERNQYKYIKQSALNKLMGAEEKKNIDSYKSSYVNEQNGQTYPCYKLPYRETMILISGYSVELRTKIIDRWIELEGQIKLPKTFSEALRLAADQADMIEIMKPKVESFEALQRSGSNMSITECSKHFALHPKTEVIPFLRNNNYLTSKDLPSQKALDQKVLIERQNQGHDGVYRGQAVVPASSLEIWRTRIVPAIEKTRVKV
jgi:phage regulator Rha-like protein